MDEEKKNANSGGNKLKIVILAALFTAVFFAGYLVSYLINKDGSRTNSNTGALNESITGNDAYESESSVSKVQETEDDTDVSEKEAETSREEEETSISDDEETSSDKDPADDKTDSSESADKELTVSVSHANEWGDDPHYVQLDIKITNNTDQAVNGWTVRIAVGENAKIDQSWSGECAIENGTLIITDVDYNTVIYSGGSCDLGVIVCGAEGDFEAEVTASEFTDEVSQNQQNNNQSGTQNGNEQENTTMLEVPEATTDDWLYVDGNKIVDADGNEVWITGINWFGYNTGTNTFDGLWTCDLNTSLQAIADHGFNLLRIPISAELILQWKNGEYPSANFNQATNFYLVGMNSLEIFDYIIGQCRANGIKIMMDIHSANTDSSGHMVNLWYNDTITTDDYISALAWMAERYANDDTILAYDLKNEPHGKPYESEKAIWNDSTDENNWKYAAERAALAVLEKNPNVLIMVEGTEIYPTDIEANSDYSSTDDDDYYFNWWGGNLRGVADYPIDLGEYQNKLVYSPHDYGPAVYQQPWFYDGYDYDSLYEDCWYDNWFYIYNEEIAPLLIGEWGGFMTEPNLTWMTHLRTLIKKYRLNHTFWCFNANSGDTGGLVKDDFVTWDEEKYEFVKEVLWQEDGMFVGLDHEIPLGTAGNGMSLGDLYD